jgi:hypothetical protein
MVHNEIFLLSEEIRRKNVASQTVNINHESHGDSIDMV